MEKDEKITLWSERIHEFQSSGQTCKTAACLRSATAGGLLLRFGNGTDLVSGF